MMLGGVLERMLGGVLERMFGGVLERMLARKTVMLFARILIRMTTRSAGENACEELCHAVIKNIDKNEEYIMIVEGFKENHEWFTT
jgi:hypothetical protein